jgi:ribosomal-protein-alanine N-acetyltransferase
MPELAGPVVPAGRLAGTPQPRITVDDLLLRPWAVSDAPALVEIYGDPDIQRWHVRSMTPDEALGWVLSWHRSWETESGAGWAVEADGRLVGRIGLRGLSLSEGHGEAGYWVVPQARGRSVAGRSLDAMTQWAFDDVGLHRVWLEHSVHNEASCRVALRSGFAVEGTKRRSALHADGWHDMHLHARVHED